MRREGESPHMSGMKDGNGEAGGVHLGVTFCHFQSSPEAQSCQSCQSRLTNGTNRVCTPTNGSRRTQEPASTLSRDKACLDKPDSLIHDEEEELAMMQITESYNQKNSLFNAMNRFIGAVNNMDQTVMVPSLLRDVPLDDEDVKTERTATDDSAYLQQDGDMYSSYVLLKSIRKDIEWGVLQADERRMEKAGATEVLHEDDLEKQFHFHLSGLHTVLSKLTTKAVTLTTRYKEEIGCRN